MPIYLMLHVQRIRLITLTQMLWRAIPTISYRHPPEIIRPLQNHSRLQLISIVYRHPHEIIRPAQNCSRLQLISNPPCLWRDISRISSRHLHKIIRPAQTRRLRLIFTLHYLVVPIVTPSGAAHMVVRTNAFCFMMQCMPQNSPTSCNVAPHSPVLWIYINGDIT